MNNTDNTNSAAELGLALERANAVLSTLAACYDVKSSRFVVNDEFLVQAIASIETFVGDARKSLGAIEKTIEQSLTKTDFQASIEVLKSTEIQKVLPEQSQRFAIDFVEAPNELASSFDELLRKVTAAEVFAAEGQSNQHSQVNAALVPLLKSLRNDLQKLRVA